MDWEIQMDDKMKRITDAEATVIGANKGRRVTLPNGERALIRYLASADITPTATNNHVMGLDFANGTARAEEASPEATVICLRYFPPA
jgi:hypothetical protein